MREGESLGRTVVRAAGAARTTQARTDGNPGGVENELIGPVTARLCDLATLLIAVIPRFRGIGPDPRGSSSKYRVLPAYASGAEIKDFDT